MWSTPFSPTVFDSVWFPICSLQTLLESAWVLCILHQPCCMPFHTIMMRSTGSANFWWSSMSTPRLRLRNLSANSKNSMKNTLLQRSPLLLSKFLWRSSSCSSKYRFRLLSYACSTSLWVSLWWSNSSFFRLIIYRTIRRCPRSRRRGTPPTPLSISYQRRLL